MSIRAYKAGATISTDTPGDLLMVVGGTVYAAAGTFQSFMKAGAAGGVAYQVTAAKTFYCNEITAFFTATGTIDEIGYGDVASAAAGARPTTPISWQFRNPSLTGMFTWPVALVFPAGKFPYYKVSTADVTLWLKGVEI